MKSHWSKIQLLITKNQISSDWLWLCCAAVSHSVCTDKLLVTENCSSVASNTEMVQSDFRVGAICFIMKYKPLLFGKINERNNQSEILFATSQR